MDQGHGNGVVSLLELGGLFRRLVFLTFFFIIVSVLIHTFLFVPRKLIGPTEKTEIN